MSVHTGETLDVAISRDAGEVVISARGSISAVSSSTLAHALSSVLAEAAPLVVLDLAAVSAIVDERAWVIGEAAGLFRSRGTEFAVRAPNPDVRHALEDAHLGWLEERPKVCEA